MRFIVLSILLSVCECYRILVLLPYPGKSHHMVFEPVLEELTNRGHHLTVVSFFPSTKPSLNRRDISLIGLAPLNVEIIDLKDYDSNPFMGQKLYDFYTQFAMIRQITIDNIKLCEKILNSDLFEEFVQSKGDYDVIMLEYFNSDCMLGIAHNYGLPIIGLMSCTLLHWTPSLVGGNNNPATFPSLLLPFTEDMTFLEKLENSFDLMFHKYWHKYVSMSEQKLLETRLGRRLPPLEEIAKNASVVLMNTYYSLNGVRVLPPSVVEVGGIHLYNRSVQPLPEDLEQWVSHSKYGVILFSFGSLIRSSTLPPKRLAAILKVFARLPQRVVWKWEGENIENLPENVRILKWLPQYDLLNHPNCVAFLTHGGLLSLTEAVAAGIPVLIVPVLGDQPGNAVHAARAGIAETLAFNEISKERLHEALMKVLSPEMKARAKAFSKQWWDRPIPPMDTAIHYIEKTARYGHLNMSSHARLLSHPHLLFFDALAYIVFFSLLFIVYKCGSFCMTKSKVKIKQC